MPIQRVNQKGDHQGLCWVSRDHARAVSASLQTYFTSKLQPSSLLLQGLKCCTDGWGDADISMRGYLIVYDNVRGRIGWVRKDCRNRSPWQIFITSCSRVQFAFTSSAFTNFLSRVRIYKFIWVVVEDCDSRFRLSFPCTMLPNTTGKCWHLKVLPRHFRATSAKSFLQFGDNRSNQHLDNLPIQWIQQIIVEVVFL